jgi:hypothetical protein
MKLFILGAVLLLISTVSLADSLPGAAGPPAKSDTTSGAKAPPGSDSSQEHSGTTAPGPSCRRAAYGTCKGCSITCAQGEKAVCSDPLYNWNANKCVRDAACNCKPPRRRS